MKLNNAKPKKQNAQDWKLSKHGLFSENHFFFYKSFLRLCTVYTLWLCSSLMHHFVWLSVIICHLVVARFHCWGQAHLGLRPSHLRPIWHRPSPFRPSSLRQSPLRPSPIRPSPLRSSPLSPSPLRPSPLRPSPLRPSPLRPSPLRPSQHRVEMSFNPLRHSTLCCWFLSNCSWKPLYSSPFRPPTKSAQVKSAKSKPAQAKFPQAKPYQAKLPKAKPFQALSCQTIVRMAAIWPLAIRIMQDFKERLFILAFFPIFHCWKLKDSSTYLSFFGVRFQLSHAIWRDKWF